MHFRFSCDLMQFDSSTVQITTVTNKRMDSQPFIADSCPGLGTSLAADDLLGGLATNLLGDLALALDGCFPTYHKTKTMIITTHDQTNHATSLNVIN